MDSESKDACIGLVIFLNIFLLIFFPLNLYLGYQGYIQTPKDHQQTQCTVHEADVMKWTNGNFLAIWTVSYNDNESEKRSKIFVNDYRTFTDAFEATINHYMIDQVYKCYFKKNKPYDLLWTIDNKVNRGKYNMIAAFVFGIALLMVWMILFVWSCSKWYRNRMAKARKIRLAEDNCP